MFSLDSNIVGLIQSLINHIKGSQQFRFEMSMLYRDWIPDSFLIFPSLFDHVLVLGHSTAILLRWHVSFYFFLMPRIFGIFIIILQLLNIDWHLTFFSLISPLPSVLICYVLSPLLLHLLIFTCWSYNKYKKQFQSSKIRGCWMLLLLEIYLLISSLISLSTVLLV